MLDCARFDACQFIVRSVVVLGCETSRDPAVLISRLFPALKLSYLRNSFVRSLSLLKIVCNLRLPAHSLTQESG